MSMSECGTRYKMTKPLKPFSYHHTTPLVVFQCRQAGELAKGIFGLILTSHQSKIEAAQ